jgi:hypothetical protein
LSLGDNQIADPTIKATSTKMLATLDNKHDHAVATGSRFTFRSSLPFSSRLSRYT